MYYARNVEYDFRGIKCEPLSEAEVLSDYLPEAGMIGYRLNFVQDRVTDNSIPCHQLNESFRQRK